MMAQRVTFLDHEEALAVCAKIKAKHPDILERQPDGVYRYQVADPDMRKRFSTTSRRTEWRQHGPGRRMPGVLIGSCCKGSRDGTDRPERPRR